MKLCVITKVPDPDKGEDGNLALALPLYFQPNSETKPLPALDVIGAAIITIMAPVFWLGEILVVDEGGREIGGKGRKPSKWAVEYEEFDDLAEAVRRSREVQA